MSNAVSWQVDTSSVYYQITRSVTLYSLSQDFTCEGSEIRIVIRMQYVNSLPCMEDYHTIVIEPFVLPKPLPLLGFSVNTLTGKDRLLLTSVFCEHTACFATQTAEESRYTR